MLEFSLGPFHPSQGCGSVATLQNEAHHTAIIRFKVNVTAIAAELSLAFPGDRLELTVGFLTQISATG